MDERDTERVGRGKYAEQFADRVQPEFDSVKLCGVEPRQRFGGGHGVR
jgi:hypothetical protein